MSTTLNLDDDVLEMTNMQAGRERKPQGVMTAAVRGLKSRLNPAA